MFHFKQFTIRQDRCAMKVGTDGVLLGAWTDVQNAKRILDIGTGTGLIALMLAQRTKNAMIDAIEIEENAAEQAAENVGNSPWKNRIKAICTPLQKFFPTEKYDVIVSNPPYFSNSLKNPDKWRKIARHTDSLTPEELFCKRLLQPNGKLSLIFPAEEGCELIKYAETESFFCTRLTRVFPKPNTKTKRLLMEFSPYPAPFIENEIIIENGGRHKYSEKYRKLTQEFYLKL